MCYILKTIFDGFWNTPQFYLKSLFQCSLNRKETFIRKYGFLEALFYKRISEKKKLSATILLIKNMQTYATQG